MSLLTTSRAFGALHQRGLVHHLWTTSVEAFVGLARPAIGYRFHWSMRSAGSIAVWLAALARGWFVFEEASAEHLFVKVLSHLAIVG